MCQNPAVNPQIWSYTRLDIWAMAILEFKWFFVPELCTSYPVADPLGLTPRILSHLELGGLRLSSLVQRPFLGLLGLSFTKKISKPR